MRVMTREQMQELDRRTISEFDLPGYELMRRAGHWIVEEIKAIEDDLPYADPFIQCFAGRGNNGGDVFAAALKLHKEDFFVVVLLAGTKDSVRGDARKHMNELLEAGGQLMELPTVEHWHALRDTMPPGNVIVDGLLGIGIKGEPRGPVAAAIEYIRMHADQAVVLSLDIPSGLNPDTGEAGGVAVVADITLTMGLPKRGLLMPAAYESVGALRVADLGFPVELIDEIGGDPEFEMVHREDLRPLWPVRRRAAHKGDCGRVLIIGGSRRYAGAPSLAGRSALCSGAGLVTVWTPERVAPIVAGHMPELIVVGGPDTDTGSLSKSAWDEWKDELNNHDVIVVGPGMTTHPDTLAWVRLLLKHASVPIILDADALTVLSESKDDLAKAKAPLVLTPHPGEFATLFGMTVSDVQADRIQVAKRAATQTKATVVLKGSHTVIAHADRITQVNATGNPGMATAGSGDVLAGLLAALIGQGVKPADAAGMAVHVHGVAGDMAISHATEMGLTATKIIDAFPSAFRYVIAG